MDARLTINGVEIKLGHKGLLDISYSIDDCKRNAGVFHELAKSHSSEIRSNVSGNKHLKDKTFDMLLQDSSLEVMRAIICHDHFKKRMDKAIIERFIETGDTEILISIATEIDEFVSLYDVCEMDWLCEKLIVQKDPAVLYELAANDSVPIFFMSKLAEHYDVNIAEKAEKTLSALVEDEIDEDDE